MTPDFVDDAWDCTTHPVECGKDAVRNRVHTISTASTIVAYADSFSGPFSEWWLEVGSFALTEVSIALSDCPLLDKLVASAYNLSGLAVGLGGKPALAAAAAVGGPWAAGGVAATVFASEIGFATLTTITLETCDTPESAHAASSSSGGTGNPRGGKE